MPRHIPANDVKDVFQFLFKHPTISSIFQKRPAEEWKKLGEKRTLKLFKAASERVPAYKKFLKTHKINPEKIKNWKEFSQVPPMDKDNYLRVYPLEELTWSGHLKKPLVFTSTSGSTGEPFYFPRTEKLDWQYSILLESFLKQSSHGDAGPTLVIIGFGMGIWIGGLITYQAFQVAAQRNQYSLSIITPGINKKEIFHALRKLAPHFRQTIFVGYPPFVKDIVDEAIDEGINLKKLNIRILFAAESITEEFRDYIARKVGINNIFLDIMNIYGSADLGAMGVETTLATLIKRLALKNKLFMEEIFGSSHKTPTLAQYIPYFIHFESDKGRVYLTGDNAIPLIRYQIGDSGGVFTYDDLAIKAQKHGINLEKEILKAGIRGYTSQLPFVFIFERSDFATKLYGATIYPEHIKHGIQDTTMQKYLTGKFSMATKHDKNHNQYLEIHLELKANIQETLQLKQLAQLAIVESLLTWNAEYANNYKTIKTRVTPKIILHSYEDSQYFKPGIKQNWLLK